jgi:hypothetical protein
VTVLTDGKYFTNPAVKYSYIEDPTFTTVTPQNIIPVGGIELTFNGTDLNTIQFPMITMNDDRFTTATTEKCRSISDTQLVCIAPAISSTISDDIYDSSVSYQLILDGVSSLNYNNSLLQLVLRRDPFITGLSEESRILTNAEMPREITLQGRNLLSVEQSEVDIKIENEDCSIQHYSEEEIICIPLLRPYVAGTTVSIQVKIGKNLYFPTNGTSEFQQWTLLYYVSAFDDKLIAIIVISVIVVVLCVILIVIVLYYKCRLRKASKKSQNPIERSYSFVRGSIHNTSLVRSHAIVSQGNLAYNEMHLYEALHNSELDVEQPPLPRRPSAYMQPVKTMERLEEHVNDDKDIDIELKSLDDYIGMDESAEVGGNPANEEYFQMSSSCVVESNLINIANLADHYEMMTDYLEPNSNDEYIEPDIEPNQQTSSKDLDLKFIDEEMKNIQEFIYANETL